MGRRRIETKNKEELSERESVRIGRIRHIILLFLLLLLLMLLRMLLLFDLRVSPPIRVVFCRHVSDARNHLGKEQKIIREKWRNMKHERSER
jgi:hypothetical protein